MLTTIDDIIDNVSLVFKLILSNKSDSQIYTMSLLYQEMYKKMYK